MKNFKLIFLALSVALFSSSCLVDDEDSTLDQMENTTYAFGFNPTVRNIAYFEDLGAINEPVSLGLLAGGDGAGADNNMTVQYEVNQDLTTATAGVEYNINGELGTVVIPSGEEFGMIDLVVNTASFNPTETTTLVLDITSAPQGTAIVADNSRVTISFIGCLSLVDQFSYNVTSTDGSGNIVYTGTETLTPVGVNTFRTISTGSFGPGELSPPAAYDGFVFVDVCGTITVDSQNLGGYYTNLVFGEGSVDENGNITIVYTVTFAAGDQVFTTNYVKIP